MASPNPPRRDRETCVAVVLLLLAAITAATGPAMATGGPAQTGADQSSGTPEGRIVAVGPNPAADGDAGEFVAVHLPTEGNWSLSDGETVVRTPNRSGTVVLTAGPDRLTRRLRDGEVGDPIPSNATVVHAPVSLANGGERLALRRAGRAVHRVEYGPAPEAELYLPETDEWRPTGLEPRAAVATGPANATAFVLPDAPEVPVESVAGADERVLLAGYTFASPRVADELVAAVERGVTVRVLVEANPVGGVSRQQGRTLDRLHAAGVEVRVVGVEPARFAFHHPKYAVVDDHALVMTENWKPAGTGGKSSRGWGVRVASSDLARELSAVFAHDISGPDVRPWAKYRRGRRFETHSAAGESFPSTHAPESVAVEDVTLLTAPGNAESTLVERIDAADSRLDVVQPTLGTQENALVRATLRAARRGVDVRILLSGGWYVAEENAELVRWLNDWAERNDAPLEAKISAPKERYEKIHAKGVLVDDDVAVVGSLNWNRKSARENREVALALSGQEPVAYYRAVFEADWHGGEKRRRGVFLAGGLAAVVVAGAVAYRTVSFATVRGE